MKYNEIDIYVNDILKKQLQKLKLPNYGLYSILNNVKQQLYSLIKNYHDKEFINAIFLTVCEEGNFYEPKISNELGCLVVLTIRDSLYEVIASVSYKEYGLKEPVDNDFTKMITSSALEYFKDVDLDKLSKNIDIDEEDDYYRKITDKYPVTMKALKELAKLNDKMTECEYKKVITEKYDLIELNKEELKEKTDKTLLNGYSLEIDDNLIHFLKGIKENKSHFFYVDSFKYLSRNLDKNLRIIEFILTHDALFLTSNFYISNGYVSRRENIIRSSHGKNINMEAINTITDITKSRKEYLFKVLGEK